MACTGCVRACTHDRRSRLVSCTLVTTRKAFNRPPFFAPRAYSLPCHNAHSPLSPLSSAPAPARPPLCGLNEQRRRRNFARAPRVRTHENVCECMCGVLLRTKWTVIETDPYILPGNVCMYLCVLQSWVMMTNLFLSPIPQSHQSDMAMHPLSSRCSGQERGMAERDREEEKCQSKIVESRKTETQIHDSVSYMYMHV